MARTKRLVWYDREGFDPIRLAKEESMSSVSDGTRGSGAGPHGATTANVGESGPASPNDHFMTPKRSAPACGYANGGWAGSCTGKGGTAGDRPKCCQAEFGTKKSQNKRKQNRARAEWTEEETGAGLVRL